MLNRCSDSLFSFDITVGCESFSLFEVNQTERLVYVASIKAYSLSFVAEVLFFHSSMIDVLSWNSLSFWYESVPIGDFFRFLSLIGAFFIGRCMTPLSPPYRS